MKNQLGLSAAYLLGELQGPPGIVVNTETGEPLLIGDQNFGHTHPGREVIVNFGGLPRGYVVDVQHPANTPPDQRDPLVDYSADEARLRMR